jgi:ABC-type uncharacterized transport system substrate-binding protein
LKANPGRRHRGRAPWHRGRGQGKQLEFAREVIPDVRKVGMLVNMRNPAALFQRNSAETAAPGLGVTLISAEIN